MVGSELAGNAQYLLRRAQSELDISPHQSSAIQRLAGPYLRCFGIPEIGLQMRIRRVARMLPKNPGTVLDIGCGSGILLGEIERKKVAAELVGIEIDSTSAELAKSSHPNAKISCGDFLSVAAEFRGRADFATCIDVLEHIEDSRIAHFINECITILKPGGRLIVHVPAARQYRHLKRFRNWTHHDHVREGFSEDDLKTLLLAAGLQEVAIKGTFGFLASLAWELNMLVAASPLQALCFPPLMLLAMTGDSLPSKKYNGLLAVGRRGH